MKILAITRGDAASFYRIEAPFSVLKQCTRHTFDYASPGAATDVGDYDVLWMNQPASAEDELLARKFSAHGVRVVVDVDDWLFELPPSWSCYGDYYDRASGQPTQRMKHYAEILGVADIVTCTSQMLAMQLYGKMGKGADIRVLPNCVLRGAVDGVVTERHKLDGPLVGWYGTDNYWDDWREIAEAVDDALEEVGGYLMLIGAPSIVAGLPRRLAARTHVYLLYPINQFAHVHRLIGACDVGLAWCTEYLAANSLRSPLKALHYGAAGVYTVASDTVYGQVLQDFGLVCDDVDTLTDMLVMACDGTIPLKDKGAEWQAEVWRSHTYEENAPLWQQVLESA